MNVFICLENPDSWLGDKTKNVGAKVPTVGASKNVEQRDAKYRPRKELAGIMHDKSVERDRKGLRQLMKKPPWATTVHVGYASSGSLPSMLSRLIAYQATLGAPIDTIVFVGHGDETGMSAGIGHLALGGDLDRAETILSYRKREISVTNAPTWTPTFGTIANHVAPGAENGSINVFLLGCETGKGELLSTLAEALNGIFNQPVVVYGFDKKSDWYDAKDVLSKIQTIVTDTFNKKKGSFPVNHNQLKFAARV
jgi:hypothetical protein